MDVLTSIYASTWLINIYDLFVCFNRNRYFDCMTAHNLYIRLYVIYCSYLYNSRKSHKYDSA